jgi:GTA TIM-barrel-like domain/Putative phage tail protein
MATLALSTAGSIAGDFLLPGGASAFDFAISGAELGAGLGKLAGGAIDSALFSSSGQSRVVQGPRLTDLHVTSSTEGAPIPRVYGRARLGGQVIWATDFDEEVATSEAGGGGKGGAGGGGAAAGATTTVSYSYYANFAVGLCEGIITGVGRIWANGVELDLAAVSYRIYTGSATQQPDGLIVARSAAAPPAFRGLAYIVFEHLALADFGNRMPQLSFEVFRALDDVSTSIKGVVLIPGSGEFVLADQAVTRNGFGGERFSENGHSRLGATDFTVAVDQLEVALPNAKSVSLVSSWFGTDLRADHCQIMPSVERAAKETAPLVWSVAGLSRGHARVVTQRDGRPAYGGTPSDSTVIAAIRNLVARGLNVTLTPFLLMDIAGGNTLPNPYGGATQPAYPWRGRVTCSPAPGQSGSPDKTAEAAAQLAGFIGTAKPADFLLAGDQVVYNGPTAWSFRRFILHHAYLAKAAGGVGAFVIGSELRGLTTVRGAAGSYPFVAALVQLAADVRSVLGPTVKITYAADWSEYFGHQPTDRSGDVTFHLDPLWASPAIDAIGIDLYWPLTDWRAGRDHRDALAGVPSVYDLAYLKSGLQGGEGFDWYYASDADRQSQARTPITDGLGKPWVFRTKDLKSWWLNRHYNRIGGVELMTPTAWLPQSKPVWLMEIGCPAVDKGANQPNVFVDPKSVESSLPYFSNGRRDDLMQRRYIQALIEGYDPTHPDHVTGLNPVSSVYGSPMVTTGRVHVYAWDTRPYPGFPNDVATWSDGSNWRLGHWLNGRIASMPLSDVVGQIMDDYQAPASNGDHLAGIVPGYVIDRIMSPRDALQPLELAYFFDSLESEGEIVFRHRGAAAAVATVTESDLVEASAGAPLLTLTRGQETDLPAAAKIAFLSATADYHRAVASAGRLASASGRVAQADLPILLDPDQAGELADAWLFETWAARERAAFSLPPSHLAVEPGDAVIITRQGRDHLLRVTEIGDHGARSMDARGLDPDVYDRIASPERVAPTAPPIASGQPLVMLLDLPLLTGDEPVNGGYVAAAQYPWPGALALYQSPDTTGFKLACIVNAAAVMGETLSALPEGPTSRLDYGNQITVQIGAGQLTSATALQLLAGANVAALRTASGAWEVLQFTTATLIAAQTYQLSGLLRGQAGTEVAMEPLLAAGASFLLVSNTLTAIDLTAAQVGLPLQWRIGPAVKDMGSANYVQVSHAFLGLGARPLSPVHVRGSRRGDDLALSWVRRTRRGGDNWVSSDVPLAEDSERYEADILDGTTVKRTLSSVTPDATYTAAMQVADFGAVQPSINLKVYQLSATWGRGVAANATI